MIPMISKINSRVKFWIARIVTFTGLAVVILGGLVVKLGAWMGDLTVVTAMAEEVEDITDEELMQIYREASEARNKKEEK